MRSIGRQRTRDEVCKDIGNQRRKWYPDLTHFHNMDKVGRYWLGFIWADGCLKPHSKHNKSLRLTIALQYGDKSHLLKLADDLKLSHEVVRFGNIGKYKMCSIRINDNDLAATLSQYGINPRSNKTYKKHVPNLPDYKDYVRGIIDGDGCLYFKQNKNKVKNIKILQIPKKLSFLISIAITYKSYGNEIQKIIENMVPGGGRVALYKQKNIWYIKLYSHKAERLADLLYGNNPNRYLDRKYQKYLKWKQYLTTRPLNPYLYQRKVQPDQEKQFIQAWMSGTKKNNIKKMFNINDIEATIKRLNLPRRYKN